MTVRYRTAGPWGAGLGSNLSPAQVDENFYTIAQALAAFTPPPGVGISSITMAGDSMTIHLSDGSTQGPFVLPTAAFQFTGDWQPDTDYAPLNIFVEPNSGMYLVSLPYHSPDGSTDDPFNPNVVDTDGNKLLQLVLPISISGIPVFRTSTEDTASYLLHDYDQGAYRCFVNTSGDFTTTDFVTEPVYINVVVPLDPAFPPGYYVYLRQGDDHQVSVVGEDTSINIDTMETTRSLKKGAVMLLVYFGSNQWMLSGDLELASTGP